MVVGPRSPSVVSVVSSTCNAFHVPHVETSWSTVGASGVGSEGRLYSLNVFPHPDILSRAYLDLVLKKNRWKSVTVIYEDSESFVRMKEVLNTSFAIGAVVNLELFNPSIAVKTLLKRIDSSKEFNIVLDVATERVVEFLEAASEIGMMTEYYNYVITSLDTHTLDVSKFKNTLANVSALRLVDLEKWDMKKLLHDWTNSELRFGRKALELTALKTELALLFDAVMLFARALHDMEHIENFELKSFNCDIPANWTNGEALLQRMKTVQVKGLTGPLRLDDKGLRTDFSMNIIELKSTGFEKVGTWNKRTGIRFSRAYMKQKEEELSEAIQNRTFRVTTIVNPPYTMLKKDAHLRVGNDRFEGYCVDLMDALAKKIGFQYSLHLVKDGLYGSQTSSGEWNGMIRELIDREADMAIVDLTITYVREEAVDFTMPFMNTGISILFRKPLIGDAPLFSFLFPFSVDVWLYMLTAYLALSLWYCLLGRFSPMENKHTFGENCEPKDLDDIAEELGMTNRFWFAIGSLMQQGSDLNPSAVSTRIIASIWWFFTLIMISSYTANLAAFLTAQRLTSPIENVNDLAKQTNIDYGCLESGSTKTFFHDSDSALIKRMWAAMTAAQPSVFADSNLKGVERVLRGGYAYLMESTTIEYMVQKNCQLTQIGGLLDSKGYGIATPPVLEPPNPLNYKAIFIVLLEHLEVVVGGDSRQPNKTRAVVGPGQYIDFESTGLKVAWLAGRDAISESCFRGYVADLTGEVQIVAVGDAKEFSVGDTGWRDSAKNAKIRNVLSAAIVEFHEGDLLFKLKEKWWKTRNPPDPASLGKCKLYANASSSASNSEMSLSSVGGVFIVLFVGCVAGAVIGIGEFVWELQKIPYGERESIIAEMFHACKLVVTCRGRKFSPISPSLEASLDGDAALRSTPQSSTKS